MTKINDEGMTPERRLDLRTQFESHAEVLRDIHRTESDRAQKYLLLTNSGASIATVSFLGANANLRSVWQIWVSLACFVFGIICCGFLTAINYHHSKVNFLQWLVDGDAFFKGVGHIEDATARLNNSKISRIAEGVAYLAFFVFIVGVAFALTYMILHLSADTHA